MRELSVYGLIGAIFGVLAFLILATISVPAYDEYLMPLVMYRDIVVIAPLAAAVETISAWLPWTMLILFVWIWFLVAGRLHPALARMPFGGETNRLWAWMVWIGGGALLLAALFLMLSIADPGLYGMGGGTDIPRWIVAVAAAALVWLLVSPQAFGRFGNHHPDKLSWQAVARTAALGVLFVLVFGLIAKGISVSFMAWFTTVTEALDRSMEPSTFGWVMMSLGMVVMLALGSAVAFGLLPAFVPGAGNWRARVAATRPAQLLTTGALAVGVVALLFLASIDALGNKKLADVAELSDIRALSLRLVKFCADSNCRVGNDRSANPALMVKNPVTQVPAFGLLHTGGDVPLHPETVAALERFVAGKGKHSILRKSAMMAATEVHSVLWQPRAAFQLVDRFTRQGSMKHGSLLHSQIKLAWLMRAAPINAETRAMLEELSDPERYFIGARAAARLAAAWARFGDMPRAEAMLVLARQASPGKYDHIKLVPDGFNHGQLTGQIAMPGVATDGIRVGLFRLTDDPTKKNSPADAKYGKSPKGAGPVFGNTGVSLLADSVVLKADGQFTFQNLGTGDYYVAMLIPDEKLKGQAALTGINVPDLIKLSATAPRRNLGVIRLLAL